MISLNRSFCIALTYLAVFLLLLTSISAEEDLNLAGELEIESEVTMPINFVETKSNPSISYLDIWYSWLPRSDYRQEVIDLTTKPASTIEDNTAYFRITKIRDFDLNVKFKTKTTSYPIKVNKKIDFPIKELDPEVIEFTKETELIDITPEIRNLATDLAKGEDDLYVVVFKLADWVNTNIEYDLSTVTAEANLPSSWVLKNREGVCDEMSNLFVSMVRSLGIPAKTVSGIAYTDSEQFL